MIPCLRAPRTHVVAKNERGQHQPRSRSPFAQHPSYAFARRFERFETPLLKHADASACQKGTDVRLLDSRVKWARTFGWMQVWRESAAPRRAANRRRDCHPPGCTTLPRARSCPRAALAPCSKQKGVMGADSSGAEPRDLRDGCCARRFGRDTVSPNCGFCLLGARVRVRTMAALVAQ